MGVSSGYLDGANVGARVWKRESESFKDAWLPALRLERETTNQGTQAVSRSQTEKKGFGHKLTRRARLTVPCGPFHTLASRTRKTKQNIVLCHRVWGSLSQVTWDTNILAFAKNNNRFFCLVWPFKNDNYFVCDG